MSLRDNNTHGTMTKVHHLPLPPQALISDKPNSVPKKPRQSRWQKGKLIGRGTFGSVYVGSNRDIKVAILLVDANGVVKLADFGMAKHFLLYYVESTYRLKLNGNQAHESDGKLDAIAITRSSMAK
uniref:Mitogen-activated protein kinase kinase kinase YODA-like n=1 Tax=Tanacetum cinerariifolium TaxID=118510 RepID=A0A6L2KAZ2_TANCI|nr:mitogen-activated protein kinase kinase kinase YODA-like [Tanacetum cinerariifolium]